MNVDIQESRMNRFVEAYLAEAERLARAELPTCGKAESDGIVARRLEVARKMMQGLRDKGPAYLPPLEAKVAPTTVATLRALGFKGRLTRKAVLAWFDGE